MSTVQSTRAYLKDFDDWDRWFAVKKQIAHTYGIWDYVDPSKGPSQIKTLIEPTEPTYEQVKVVFVDAPAAQSQAADPPQPQRQQRPTTFADLDPDEKEEWKQLSSRYIAKQKEYRDLQKLLGDFVKDLIETIDGAWGPVYENQMGPYAILKSLQTYFSQSAIVKEQDVVKQWNKLAATKPTDKGTNIDLWLNMWLSLYEKGKKENVPEVIGFHRPALKFVDSVGLFNPSWAANFRIQLASPQFEKEFASLVAEFRSYYKSEQLAPKPRGRHGAFAAGEHVSDEDAVQPTLQGKDKDGEEKKKKACLCGSKHAWGKCYYIVEEARPSDWTPNKDVMEKVNKKIKDNLHVSKTVQKIRDEARGRKFREQKSAGSSKEAKDGGNMPESS
jgi:hypothetical protein